MDASLGTKPAHALHHGGEIHRHVAMHLNTELTSITNIGSRSSGPKQRLGRHAANIQAVGAHQSLFNERGAWRFTAMLTMPRNKSEARAYLRLRHR